jgi:hypothetical protein
VTCICDSGMIPPPGVATTNPADYKQYAQRPFQRAGAAEIADKGLIALNAAERTGVAIDRRQQELQRLQRLHQKHGAWRGVRTIGQIVAQKIRSRRSGKSSDFNDGDSLSFGDDVVELYQYRFEFS